ncbi:MAG: Tc toxin subunit A, partial [Syntrophothermus sp.]
MGDETKNYTSKITFLLKAKERSKTGKQLKEFAAEEKTAIEERLRDHLETTASSIKEELIQKLPGKTEVVENVFSRIKQTGLSQMEDKSLGDVISSSMTDEEKNQLGAEELKKMNDVLSSSGSLKVKNLLNLNTRLQDNPILKEELRREKTIEYAGIAGLESEKISALTEKKIDLTEINETALNDLVRENLITEDQKSNIRRITQFGRLTGDDMDLVKAINVSSPVELADWDASHWLNLIESNNIPVPDDEESAKSYAENLRETVERSFPTRYFMQRVVKKADSDEITRLSESIDPLIKRSLKLFSGGAAEMESLTAADLEGIEAEKQAQIKNDFAQLKPIVNRYRHMGVGEIIDRDITVPEKQAEISRRLGALDKFYSNNKGMNLEFADFTVNLKVKKDGHRWDDIDDNIKPLVQKQMAAYQRAYMLGENYDTADLLLKKGYDSAYKITSMSETDFVKDSGLGVEKGRRVYRRAGDIAAGASHSFEAFRDGTKNVFRKTPVSNQYPLVNDLKEIEGYDSMFNSQNYCECEHCRSMLGPAAYFTDLMYFIQEKISKKVFTGNYSKHPLYLKRRRPDLWKMKLTCNNTSEEIPYLDLVNETLEGYLNSELAVNDVYEELEKADWSVNQPISLSLEKLRLYLSHFDLKLPDIYKNMKAGEQKTLSEKLKLSPEELRIITKDDPSCDDAGTLKRFGQSDLNEFNVQKFIGYAGITRSELDDLLKTSFYPEISQIKISSISDNSDIQKSYEVIDNLTGSILDLIHRYLRLWKKTPWNIREYDLLLTSMQNAGLLKKLEDKTGEGYPKILGLAQWKTIQDALKLTVEELASVIHQLPEKSIADNVKSFAVRTFDPEKIAGFQLNEKIPQVLAGLGITQAELLILLDLLGIDQAASIDIGILSKLFRQARIAKSLKMKAEDFHNAASLVLKKDLPENADDIEKMVEFTAWLKKSSLKMPEIAFILTGKENTSNKYKIDEETIAAKILEIQEKDYEGLGDAAGGKTQKMQEYLKEYLLSKFNLTEDLLDLEFPQANFDNASTQALAATFTNEEPDNPDVFNELLGNVHQLERYA